MHILKPRNVLRASLILLLTSSLFLPVTTLANVPPVTCKFYGTVTVDWAPAANGIMVTASIDGAQVASATVSGGSYVITLPEALTDTNEGKTVTFAVAGNVAAQTGTWTGGGVLSLNLTAVSTPGAQVNLFLSPASQTVVAGAANTFTIHVSPQAGQPVPGIDAFVNFDPAVLQANSFVMAAGCPLNTQYYNSIDNTAGHADFSVATLQAEKGLANIASNREALKSLTNWPWISVILKAK